MRELREIGFSLFVRDLVQDFQLLLFVKNSNNLLIIRINVLIAATIELKLI